jgi:hypothetical protein
MVPCVIHLHLKVTFLLMVGHSIGKNISDILLLEMILHLPQAFKVRELWLSAQQIVRWIEVEGSSGLLSWILVNSAIVNKRPLRWLVHT